MRFGLFYELQVPRPWDNTAELRVFQQSLDEIEFADRLGIDYVWQVEHHFLEEYSHSSSPEIFLAACSQRTKRIRLGHGIKLMAPSYNHPARAAEQIAALDLVSGGRVEWGTGESATGLEMGGFHIDPAEKSDQWREGVEQAANMLAMTPYPGFKGKYFEMPCRNIVPKPAQRPHPPVWMGCSRRESIQRAARNGLGALCFAFVEPDVAEKWVKEYYDIIKSSECVPLTHTVNANIAMVGAMSCHRDGQVAFDRAVDGFRFFGYSVGHHTTWGAHKPGRTDLWESFLQVKEDIASTLGNAGVGTPDRVRDYMRSYEQAGLDQIIFMQALGRNRHEYICESLELFSKEIMPEFQERREIAEAKKAAELAPYIEAALKRKQWMPQLKDEDIPVYQAQARMVAAFQDRGGGLVPVMQDPRKKDG
jgi:alkanesulfonate monooxygenase SsuD/methylene tetrahydromethanopterin reductase-like flavin-dependent oxidoreductase (luciferase family)